MKLELKHLAPYLSYGLKVLHEDHIAKIVQYFMPAGNYKKDCWIVSMEDTFNHELSCDAHFSEIKPILRPLSDLIKEIEVNGKKFIPAEILFSVENYELEEFKLYGKIPEYWEDALKVKYRHLDYYQVSFMFEWHFDVFGLIEQNLAIDINTL